MKLFLPLRYRRSKSIPYDGLSSVLLRACVRLNRLNKAVDMIKDKVYILFNAYINNWICLRSNSLLIYMIVFYMDSLIMASFLKSMATIF